MYFYLSIRHLLEVNFNERNYLKDCPELSWILLYTQALYKIRVQISPASSESSYQGAETQSESRSTMADGGREAAVTRPSAVLEDGSPAT